MSENLEQMEAKLCASLDDGVTVAIQFSLPEVLLLVEACGYVLSHYPDPGATPETQRMKVKLEGQLPMPCLELHRRIVARRCA